MQNSAEKQIMPFKTTVNWLFTGIWCYLVIGCFDWKIVVFQQTVVRVYYILNWLYFIVWFPLLCELLTKMCIAVVC